MFHKIQSTTSINWKQ